MFVIDQYSAGGAGLDIRVARGKYRKLLKVRVVEVVWKYVRISQYVPPVGNDESSTQKNRGRGSGRLKGADCNDTSPDLSDRFY